MKKMILLSLTLLSMGQLHAQRATKISLTKGQKIRMVSHDTSMINQKRGEETMNMKTISGSSTELEIIGEANDQYTATSTLTKMKIDFDGFGMKELYDSEDKDKQNGMMAGQLKDVIGKADTLTLDNNGKKIGDDESDKKGKGKGNGRGGGMMKMMNQGSGNIENAFLIVPAEAAVGSGWKKDATKDDVRSQTIYFVEKIEGNLATVSFKKKSKGSITRNGGPGGEMKIDIDNLSSGMITVDMSTGLVKTYTETTDTKSKTFVMGQEMPSDGKVISDIVFE